MMKKLLLSLFALLFVVTGCSFSDMMNTPTKRVEEFLGKYQTMDSEVLRQLDDTINKDTTMSEDTKKDYKDVMKKQYQNLMYKIKDETVDGDHATVQVEIEVFDFDKASQAADAYLDLHRDEFQKEDQSIDYDKFMQYKIKQMKDTKDKVKYTLDFTLTKKDSKWVLDDITDTMREKIHGIYHE